VGERSPAAKGRGKGDQAGLNIIDIIVRRQVGEKPTNVFLHIRVVWAKELAESLTVDIALDAVCKVGRRTLFIQ
jgi:hypothetical protein